MSFLDGIGPELRARQSRLSTANKLLVILNISAFLLIGSMFAIVGTILARQVYATVDADLKHHIGAVRYVIARDLSRLKTDVQMLGAMAHGDGRPDEGPSSDLHAELLPYFEAHEVDAIMLVGNNGNVIARIGADSPEFLSDLLQDVLHVDSGTSSFARAIMFDGALWLISGAPFKTTDGEVRSVLLLIRQLDQSALGVLRQHFGPEIIFADDQQSVSSFNQQATDQSFSDVVPFTRWPLEPGKQSIQNVRFSNSDFRLLIMPLNEGNNPRIVVGVFQSVLMANKIISQTFLQIMLLGLLLGTVNYILTHYLINRIFRPLESLCSVAENMSAGDLSPPARVGGSVEILVLFNALDQMRARVLEMFEAQQTWNRQLEAQVQARTLELRQTSRHRDRLMFKVISVQEEEQRRVARELHDETCQALANLILTLGIAVRVEENSATRLQLQAVKDATTDALEEVRRIVRDMRPRQLDDLGLPTALKWYVADRCRASGITAGFQVLGDERSLPPYMETAAFRVVQEAVNNIVRHSQATHAWVQLQWQPRALSIEVSDNGQGFELSEALEDRSAVRGLGLLGIQERAEIVGGTVLIVSEPGNGTRIRIDLPIPSENT